MKRKDGSFDKPPSYYHQNKRHSRDFDEPHEEIEDDLPENVIPMNRNESTAPQKRRARKGGVAEKIVLVISLVLFSLAIGGSLFRYMNTNQTTIAIVGYGSVDVPRVMSGIIVRDETVYYAPASGVVVFNVADGTRVRRGTVVSNIENSSTLAQLSAQSDDISRQIMDIQNLRGDVSAVAYAVDEINDAIGHNISSQLIHLGSSNREGLYSLASSLNQSVELRNDMLLNENAGAVRMLVNEHRYYIARISENRIAMLATESGIVSHSTDGFEDALNPGNLRDITREQTRMYVGADAFVQNTEVDAGDAVFKIIGSNTWYIVAYIENDLVEGWSPNRAIRLYIEQDGEFSGHPFWVDSITRRNERESFVVMRSDVQIQDFLNMRTVSFKTYDSAYSGLKIPDSAITERTFIRIPERYVGTVRHNITVVNRRVGNSVEQETIHIKTLRGIEHEEGYVYILQDFDNVRLGDTIVFDSHDTEGYVIDRLITSNGVFRTNTGVATFVSVDTSGMVSGDEGYIILDPQLNRGGLRQHDRIIRDANYRFVREGDIVN